jgi:hypothetical protein
MVLILSSLHAFFPPLRSLSIRSQLFYTHTAFVHVPLSSSHPPCMHVLSSTGCSNIHTALAGQQMLLPMRQVMMHDSTMCIADNCTPTWLTKKLLLTRKLCLLREFVYIYLGITCTDTNHFKAQIGNLELLCGAYNMMQQNALDVERPLFAAKLAAADAILLKGLQVSHSSSLSLLERSSKQGFDACVVACHACAYVACTS